MLLVEGKRKFGTGQCRKCREPFEKRAPNQVDCPQCSFYIRYKKGRFYNKIALCEVDLKRIADESGNPKVYRADEYSQTFLRSLIPAS